MALYQLVLDWKDQHQVQSDNKPSSAKQTDYISLLLQHSNKNLTDISAFLQRQISDINEIHKVEVGLVIKFLRKDIKVNDDQMLMLFNIFGLQEVNFFAKLCGRELQKYTDMTLHEYDIISKNIDKFTLRSVDIPLQSNDHYEHGYQFSKLCPNNTMYYIKFFSFMMLDFDNITYSELIANLDKYTQFRYAIYQTAKGYHVFIMSHSINYKDINCFKLMINLGSDPYYCYFVRNNGFKIRLNIKKDQTVNYVSKFRGYHGDEKIKILESNAKLLLFHDKLLNKYSNLK